MGGIYPNDASLIRLAGALLLEQNDEWLVGRRYLSGESLAGLHAARQTDEQKRAAPSAREVVLLAPDDPDDNQGLHRVKGLDQGCTSR